MQTVKISPKFQIVIPKEIRENLRLSPGQNVLAIIYDGRIELIPLQPLKQMRGFLKGIDTTVIREKDCRSKIYREEENKRMNPRH